MEAIVVGHLTVLYVGSKIHFAPLRQLHHGSGGEDLGDRGNAEQPLRGVDRDAVVAVCPPEAAAESTLPSWITATLAPGMPSRSAAGR